MQDILLIIVGPEHTLLKVGRFHPFTGHEDP